MNMCFKYVSRKIFITNFISILQLLWLGLFSSLRKLDLCRHPEVFLEKGVLKICMKSTGEHPSRSVISIKLQSNFIKITLLHECSPVNLLHTFRTPFFKKHLRVATSEYCHFHFLRYAHLRYQRCCRAT